LEKKTGALGRALRWIRLGRRAANRAPAPGNAAGIDPASVNTHVERVLASPEFSSANRLQQFLAFVVRERLRGVETIKETELALRVFNRRSSFDPSGDSVVRVAASNLRSRLRDYYLGTGAQDSVIIEIPKGSYVPAFRARERQAAALPSPPRRRWWIPAAFATAAIAIAAAVYWLIPARYPQSWTSIAVLPFLNLSSEAESEYLADGFVEEVTTSLAQVDGLRVAARSSAFQFRGKSPDIRTAGRQLGVQTVLEGSVWALGNKLRITAQLINAADGFHIWSHRWDSEPSGLFAIQEDLSRRVAHALRRPTPVQTSTARDPAAYELYLKGRFFRDRTALNDLAKSAEFLERSIERDSKYAPAHAALADTYASISYHETAANPQLIAKARKAAAEALRLDEALAEAHAVLAWIRFIYDWDWGASERGLRQALAFNPNSALAHDWYGQRLMSAGDFPASIAQTKEAIALDPLNYRLQTHLAVIFYCSHRYDDAIEQARKALELNPQHEAARALVGISLQEKGMYREAQVELTAATAFNPADADTVAHLAAVELKLGLREQSRKRAAELKHLAGGQPEADYQLAYLAMLEGRIDEVFPLLEKCREQRGSDMIVLGVDPVFDPLHQDPRFIALQRKMGWTNWPD
jgi:adenylate cyclase